MFTGLWKNEFKHEQKLEKTVAETVNIARYMNVISNKMMAQGH